jgi:hypothetical protein
MIYYHSKTAQALATEIESLRQQLADAHNREANARCTHCGGVFFETDLSKKLAECQASEKVLREALGKIAEIDLNNSWSCQSGMAKAALLLPSDSTALDKAIKQAKQEALLEAADKCVQNVWTGDFEDNCEVADQLRHMAKELE